MKNKILLKIGLIVVILIILAYAYSSLTENKKFTDSVITFDYPGFFIPHSFEMNRTQMQGVSYFKSIDPVNEQYIFVMKNKTEISPTELRDVTVSKNQNSSTSQVLSTSTVTNPNGIIVETIRMTISNGKPSRHNLMYFKINNTVYGIVVYGPYSNLERITDTSNAVFQSIK